MTDLFDNPMGLMGFEFVELLVRDLRVRSHLALALPPVPANRWGGRGLRQEFAQFRVLVVFELVLAHDNGGLEQDRTVRVLAHQEHLVGVPGEDHATAAISPDQFHAPILVPRWVSGQVGQ